MRIMSPTMLRAVICTAADKPPLVGSNVYYGYQLIGVTLRLTGHRYLSVRWARPVDPFDLAPSWWTRIRLWAHRRFARKPNATCNACGYHGVRTRRGKWCPSCYEDENGELILDGSH